MTFHTASDEPRPVRLSEATRNWAWESLHGKYGDETVSNGDVSLDDIEGFEALSDLQKYDCAIRRIAKRAPIRICPGEAVCGAATLCDAIHHRVPATYGGKPVFSSISHLTIRYDKVVKEGLTAYEKEIAERLRDPALDDSQILFLHSLQNVIDSIRIWHGRYLDAVKDDRPDLYDLLRQVPFGPARGYREALQSVWFIFSFVRLCGNWPGIGRLDWLLGDYLKRDLASGALDMDRARELTASFFIKGCEWIQSDTPPATGDAQHYQNIVLAGVDADGREVANEVTDLVLEVVEELAISDFPITVRLNRNSPRALKEKVARVMRHGGGIVAVYNEDLILNALDRLGYPPEEARTFANDGCWEVQVPGKTHFGYMPFDALAIFNRATGIEGDDVRDFSSVEEVYAAYSAELQKTVKDLYDQYVVQKYARRNGVWQRRQGEGKTMPTSVVSLFEDGCIDRAQSYLNMGTVYTVHSPHIGGAPDVANSLYAIDKFVFEEKKMSWRELTDALRENWEGHELERLYVKNSYTYYGNDCDESDAWHTRVVNDFADMVTECARGSDCPVKFIPGISTFGRQVDWLPSRCATAFGCKKGEILAGNDSPTPGTDTAGATCVIRSYCKADLVRQGSGAALDLKIFPESLRGENGVEALIALMEGFLTLGGFFMQPDTVDTRTLLEAQQNPKEYKTLSVRVSGWNARFVTLNKEWQNMIIERTSQGL